MHFAATFIALLWIFCGELANGIAVSYDELRQLNATCHPMDTCSAGNRTGDSPGISGSYKCSCSELCSHYRTCCVDSPYVNAQPHEIMPVCRKVERPYPDYTDVGYYMVDRCVGDSPIAVLCSEERKDESDVLKLVPVTSRDSSVTYRNYFCLRCHENTDDFLYWNVRMKNESRRNVGSNCKDVELAYDRNNGSWLAVFPECGISYAVSLKFEPPPEIEHLPTGCDPNVISTCSERWTDESTRAKCRSYTAIINLGKIEIVKPSKYGRFTVLKDVKYRNSHCALCNFKSLDDMDCGIMEQEELGGGGHGGNRGGGYGHRHRFSFAYLLDINRGDGDEVGKVKKCEENSLWDPFSKKCRLLTCALPGHTVKNGRCEPA